MCWSMNLNHTYFGTDKWGHVIYPVGLAIHGHLILKAALFSIINCVTLINSLNGIHDSFQL